MIVVQMEQLFTPTAVDPNDLLIFARVAELGSFSRAASASLSRPAATAA